MNKLVLFLTLFLVIPLFPQSTAVKISNSSNPSYDACIAINASGDIGVVWVEEFTKAYRQIYFSIRRSGRWSDPAAIPGQSGDCINPCISKGRGGAGFCAVWRDTVNNVIMLSEYGGSNWVAPYAVSDAGRSGVLFGECRVATSGSRIGVCWQNPPYGTPASDIWARTWNGSWSSIENLSYNWAVSKCPEIAAGGDGRFYVAWQDASECNNERDIFETQWNRDDGSGNWVGCQDVTNENSWLFKARIAVNSASDVFIPYYYFPLASYHASFLANGTWIGPVMASDVGDHHEHDLYWSDCCAYGDGFLFIYRDIGYNIIYRTAANGGFGDTMALSNSGWTYRPSIDYTSSVGAAAAWTEMAGAEEVYAVVFTPASVPDNPPPPPPPAIKPVLAPVNVMQETKRIEYTCPIVNVQPIENRNVFTIQYVNKVTWSPSIVPAQYNVSIQKYKIYRRQVGTSEWAFLKELGNSTLEYFDRNQVTAGATYEYSVLAVDDYGSTAYRYNCLYWQNNPKNVETNVNVAQFHIYRKVPGLYDFGGWQKVPSSVLFLEDTAPEIRYGTIFEYAVSAIDDTGKESVYTPAANLDSASNGQSELTSTNRGTYRFLNWRR